MFIFYWMVLDANLQPLSKVYRISRDVRLLVKILFSGVPDLKCFLLEQPPHPRIVQLLALLFLRVISEEVEGSYIESCSKVTQAGK